MKNAFQQGDCSNIYYTFTEKSGANISAV